MTTGLSSERVTAPLIRPRRLRRTAALRRLVAENRLAAGDLVLPMFVREGLAEPAPIPTMPGVVQHSRASLAQAVEEAAAAGVGAVMLFAVPAHRDPAGSAATDQAGILAEAVRWARGAAGQRLPIIADLCLDEFTDHGHCGVLDVDGCVDNDATLARYAEMAVVLADAGADLLGTSGMMDGQVGATRAALDAAGHTQVAILAYAAKYASAFYGPFRAAVESQLVGDRRTYQQDPANGREALREVALDVAEGADIVMVKPALAYLDVVSAVRAAVEVPVAAYVVSGEYAMIEAAAAAGLIDRPAAVMEALLGVRRAGASIIATYWATEVAGWLSEEGGPR
ncbi:MAG: porphobilinogen synthase [Candidatus Nanopelagicales bacterium]